MTFEETEVKYVMAMLLWIISINIKIKTFPKHEYDIQYNFVRLHPR